jgi:hypothetical protein
MGSAAVASWTAIIKGVQQVVEANPAEPIPDYVQAETRLLGQLFLASQQPQLPHAAWKKLLLQLKVRGWH